jgi:diacylglycerol O-acyltransferase / wax synthase
MSRLDHLTVLDELFLHLEGPNTHMHVGGVTIFEGPPPDYEEVLETVGSRLDMVPRFRQKLAMVPLSLGRPVWVDDTHFNLEYHVRHTALPAPGDEVKLKRFISRVMTQQLDRSRPLWEIWFAEGLTGDRFALISKTHHCMIDGISGVDLMSVMLDFGPEPQRIDRQPWQPEPEPSPDQLLVDAIRERMTSPAELIRSLQSATIDPRLVPHRVLESLKAVTEFVGSGFSAPPSSLNQPIGPHRRFEMVLADLREFKRVKNSLGGTVNDVVLAVVAGGLRRLLESRGEFVDDIELRVMVPVSVRGREDEAVLGNRVASVWAALPVYERDPVTRLRLAHDAMKDLKSSGQAVGAQVLTTLGEFTPPTVLAQAARLVARQRAFNLVVTNVPGPKSRCTRWAGGCSRSIR